MSLDAQTIKTYDESAVALADYFNGIGPRLHDIARGLALAGAPPKARVVEVGCGDGRDAAEIIKRCAWYEGYDPSGQLLRIARKRLPAASFVQADALTYTYPPELDVVYAFASLLHVSRQDLPAALLRIHRALKADGIAYLSLKERPAYEAEVKTDQYGKRLFYYYTPQLVQELAGSGFEAAYESHQTHGHTEWFTLALRRR